MSVSTDRPYKVCLLGASLGTGNRGVSALGASLVRLILQARPDAQISFLIGRNNNQPFELVVEGKKRTLPVINYRQSPKARLREHLAWIVFLSLLYRCLPIGWVRRAIGRNPWVDAVVQADLVGDIRGGDSFSDIYGLRNFISGSWPIITVILLRRRVTFFPQTFGPFKGRLARALAKWIAKHGEPLISRDRDSIELVEKLLGKERKIVLCPDVAFCLEPTVPESMKIVPPLPVRTGNCIIGLNVNGLMLNGGYTRRNMFGLQLDYRAYLVELCQKLLAFPGNHILFVPHTFAPPGRVESDPEGCVAVMRSLPAEYADRIYLVDHAYDQHGIKGVIGQCDFFIGSRMHSCIAALSQGIPTVGVAYSKKFAGVFETVGQGSFVIDGRTCDLDQAVQVTLDALRSRDTVRQSLRPQIEKAQHQLQSVFAQMLGAAVNQDGKRDHRPHPAELEAI